MARRGRGDPEVLLRAHFSAEIAEARLEAPPPPKLEDGFRGNEGAGGADHRAASIESSRARPCELAAAAALVLAFGLGIWTAPADNGLSRAMAENALGGGRALEVGAVFSRGFSAAITAFGRSVPDGSPEGDARPDTRFR